MPIPVRRRLATLGCAASLLALSACGTPAVVVSGSATPSLPPYGGPTVERDHESPVATMFGADSANVTNQWFPLVPGTHLLYQGVTVDGKDKVAHTIEFTVTELTKVVSGVKTRVVVAIDYEQDELVEKEIAFFAQDTLGSVWYLGEHPEEFEDGEFDKAPTWFNEIGDGHGGLVIPVNPQAGKPSFSQGWSPSVDFMDRGKIAGFESRLCIKLNCYTNVLTIEEFTRQEPNALQLKYYAPGVGNVKVGWRGDDTQKEELELVKIRTLSSAELAKVQRLALALEKHAYAISPEVYGKTVPMVQGG